MSTMLEAVVLGALEGLTEFLPVSSTGHLILAGWLMDFHGPAGHVFEIVIQFGAILAICWLYRMKIWQLSRGVLTGDAPSRGFALAVIIAVLPAIILGVSFHKTIKEVLFSPLTVAVALVVGGVLMLVLERIAPPPRKTSFDMIRWKTGLKIGLCQTLGMIPGVSRAGATMMGALMLGIERKAAAEFSFFLAIPTMLGAASYDLYKNWHHLHAHDGEIIAVGFAAAFLSALIVVRFMLRIVSTYGFAPFAYYRIVLGSGMLAYLLF